MTALMKVYFDARMIDHPGIGRYMRCLLPHIAEDKLMDLALLGNREKIKKLLGTEKNIIDFDYPIYSIQEQIGFLKLKKEIASSRPKSGGTRNDVGKEDNYILHIPHYNVPVLAKFNLVVTIHDLIHILYPEGSSGRLAPMYMKFMMKKIVKSARAVICVSQATKDEMEKMLLQKKWDSPIHREIDVVGQSLFFHVIYEGVDKVFVKMTDSAYLKSVKEKYNLPDKFILYVGSIRRHKNIAALLDSFERFKQKAPEIRLVMVGRYSQDIDINREGVIYLGELESDEELAVIYNLASCLFNLSLYEGFGLTIIEAQRCGLPVLCSDIAVHKEIGANGIIPVSPSYIDQICENLYNILFNHDIREALISKGVENAARFDWASSARKTIELYRKISDEGSDSSRLAFRDEGRRKDPQCFLQDIP